MSRAAGVSQNHKQPIPFTSTEDLAWERDAACRDEDPDMFFPETGGRAGRLQAARAIDVCHRCPLHALRGCARKALDSNVHYGVWAGEYLGTTHKLRTAARDRLRGIAGAN